MCMGDLETVTHTHRAIVRIKKEMRDYVLYVSLTSLEKNGIKKKGRKEGRVNVQSKLHRLLPHY